MYIHVYSYIYIYIYTYMCVCEYKNKPNHLPVLGNTRFARQKSKSIWI